MLKVREGYIVRKSMYFPLFLVFGFINFNRLTYKKKYRSSSIYSSEKDNDLSPKLVSNVCNTTNEYATIISSSLGLGHVIDKNNKIKNFVWESDDKCEIHFFEIQDAKKVDDIIFEFCLDNPKIIGQPFPNRINNSIHISGCICDNLIDYFYMRNNLQSYFDKYF